MEYDPNPSFGFKGLLLYISRSTDLMFKLIKLEPQRIVLCSACSVLLGFVLLCLIFCLSCLGPLTAPPAPPKPGQCPVVEPSGFGICVQECEDDSGCDGDAKCCANGCGQTCMAPIISMHALSFLFKKINNRVIFPLDCLVALIKSWFQLRLRLLLYILGSTDLIFKLIK